MNPIASHSIDLARDHFIDVNPRLHVREWAGDVNRVPFLLVHGLASNARLWDGVGARLAASGHRAVAVDLRGHGLSDKPDEGYDFATIAGDLVRLMDAMGVERPIFAGQSWGGNVALAFGVHRPALARGLCFVDGGFLDIQSRPGMTWERTQVDLRPPPLAGTPLELMRQRIQEFHPDWSDEGIEGVLANFEVLPDETVRPWLTIERHLQILHALWSQRPAELYPRVKMPVLICPARDAKNPEWTASKQAQVDAATAGLPHSKVHWFEESDHDIHVQRPVALAELMLAELRDGIWHEA